MELGSLPKECQRGVGVKGRVNPEQTNSVYSAGSGGPPDCLKQEIGSPNGCLGEQET